MFGNHAFEPAMITCFSLGPNEKPGDDYEEVTQHVYWGGDEYGWVGLDQRSQNWRVFQSQDEALRFSDSGSEVSLADGISEMSMFTGLGGLARGVLNIGARLGAKFFAREAAETATETAARGAVNGRPRL